MKRGERRRALPKERRVKRGTLITLAIAAGVFVAANVGMALAYRGRALPRTYVGQTRVGSKSFASLMSTSNAEILPASLTLTNGNLRATRTPAQLGIGVDAAATMHDLRGGWQRWLPVFSLVLTHRAGIHFQTNSDISNAAITALAESLNQPAAPPHIIFNGSDFAIAAGQSGSTLKTSETLSFVMSAVERGESDIPLPASAVPAPASAIDLNAQLQQLRKELSTSLSFSYNGQTMQPSKADKGNWFTVDGQTMSVASDKVGTYLASTGQRLGITVANQSDLETAAAYALGKNQSLTFALVPQTTSTVVRTYCTNVRDVSTYVLNELIGKLAATYADVRGWNDSGHIAFRHVSSGCQYTVWMSASSRMTSFGSICDNYYNCQVGTNVVMNYDRWTGATPPWNQAGGNLEDYHTLMIDHETGHRLGFLDNPTCPGAGQPAPVMMQQSINLKGCVFNIWPRPAEFTQLNQMLGLSTPAGVSVSE